MKKDDIEDPKTLDSTPQKLSLNELQRSQGANQVIPLSLAGIEEIAVPKNEKAWLLKRSNIFRILHKTHYAELLQELGQVRHGAFLASFLTGITQTCFDATNIGGATFGLMNQDEWRGMWIAFTLATVILYFYKLYRSFKLTGAFGGTKLSVIDDFIEAVERECNTYTSETSTCKPPGTLNN